MDVHKRVSGRKHRFVVDTQGHYGQSMSKRPAKPMARCHAAGDDDSLVSGKRLEKVFDDQAYNGVFIQELDCWSINFKKASRLESAQSFMPLADVGSLNGVPLGIISFDALSRTTNTPYLLRSTGCI